MKLELLRLRNFGCLKQEDYTLSDGVNLIFGPNFSGKSTLVNAIFFSLTGQAIVPRVDIKNIRSPKSNSGTAGLQFIVGDKRYMLYRGTRRQCQLREQIEGEWNILLDEERVTVADAALKERFGFMHERFALTTFLREGEINEFLVRQPSTRRDILYTLLGIDQLMDVRDAFIDTRRLAKREKARIDSHQSSLRFSEQKNSKTDIVRIEEKIKELEAKYTSDSGDIELVTEWKKSRIQLKSQLESLKNEQNEKLAGFENNSQMSDMIENIEKAVKENIGIETDRDQLMQKIGSTESQITELSKVCDNLRILLDQNEGHCPTCHQKVERGVIQQIVDEKEKEKTDLSTVLQGYKKTLEEMSSTLTSRQKLEQRLQTLRAINSRLDQLEQEIIKVESELNTVSTRLSERGITDDVDKSGIDVNSISPLSSQPDKGRLKRELDDKRKRLQKLKQDEAVREDRLKQLQEVNLQAENAENSLLCVELACSGVDKTIETLQHQIMKPAEEELHNWINQMDLFGQTRIDLLKQHLLPSVKIDGEDRSLMLLSGSEKMFLYLCFKVALAKVLGNTDFFVFDDPTLHLDDERKKMMVDFIKQLAKEYQVIVTSYDEDVRLGLEGAHLIEMNRIEEETISD
ncbi:AAA family ATPase [Candidatus Poribacteria bacterium]|nr:AAA family ATPase [Candidatus Poribacteria bacterium]